MKKIGQKIYVKNDGIVSRKIAGETILVPVRGKLADMRRIFTLNPVAEFIWDRVDGQHSMQSIADSIVSTFDVVNESAERDLKEFVSALLKEHLITEAG